MLPGGPSRPWTPRPPAPASLAVGVALLILGSCGRPQPANPIIPPETQYSGLGTLSASAGVMGMAVGAQMSQSGSARSRTVGTGVAAAGVGLMIPAILDAIAVGKEREKFWTLNNAFWRRYIGSPGPDESKAEPLPGTPEIPFRFADDEAEREGPKPD